ncbi:translocator protein [Acrasis kona]|uniref:Translocator protein n=1 Tax=Acrasis kona TaxID=1008807 RepID=A0AAW2ZAD8_9EUKA
MSEEFLDNTLTDILAEQPDVNLENFFDVSSWYITHEVIAEHYLSLLAAFGGVALAVALFLFARSQGVKTKWYKDLKRPGYALKEKTVLKIWFATYIPLAVASWLVFIHGGETWNRALTVYSLHLLVNVLFAVSLYWVQDLSLALLNLITLIGVAMFTVTQFNSVLKFAGYIQTPYLLWLLAYTIQFCHVWYLNEGKELMDVAKMSKGNAAATTGKKKKAFLPAHIKSDLQEKLKQQKLDIQESETASTLQNAALQKKTK